MKLLYIVCFLSQFFLSLNAMEPVINGGESYVMCAGVEDYDLLGVHTQTVVCSDACEETIDTIVARAPHLKELRVTVIDDTITNCTLSKIAQLTNLETLFFFPPFLENAAILKKNYVVTDEGFAALAKLTHLKNFAIFGFCEISNFSGCVIGQWRELEDLQICCCSKLSDALLVHLMRLGQLKRLFWYAAISNGGLQCIGHLKQLQKLVLADCSSITSEGFDYLSSLPLLKVLSMCDVHHMNDDDLKRLTRLQWLEVFDCTAENSCVTDQGIAFLKNCNNLRMLNLVGFRALTDDCLQHCIDITSLRELRVIGSSCITRRALSELYTKRIDMDIFIDPTDRFYR
ncbi:MAG: hypothetical protein US69_C0004G0021 [candidate division TM6 bacterium GW2011_GWF2_38_10]|nr:MAG: hypothetical protein US69_C0004G0021 [candidate division TM6 bacterium GW2011_GWF2_38_10]